MKKKKWRVIRKKKKKKKKKKRKKRKRWRELFTYKEGTITLAKAAF